MWAGFIGSGASPEFRAKWNRFFGCDLRSLAALRIAIASLILLDLALRLPEIDLFYTDQGLLPRSINPTPLAVFPLSVHGYAGSYAFELLLFVVAFGFAAMMLVGYRTRLATAVSWIWLFSMSGFGANRDFLFLNMMPVATMVAASSLALIVVSLLTAPPSAATIEKFFGRGS